MKKMLLSTLFILFLLPLTIFADECSALSEGSQLSTSDYTTIKETLEGTWKNQIGSTMTITNVLPNGFILGTYLSPSGTTGNEYPLIGWVNTSTANADQNHKIVVSFSVRWGEYGSIASWNGYYDPKVENPQITTQWLLVRPNTSYDWDHILTNQDVFKKVE